MLAAGDRVHLRHSYDPLFAAVLSIPGIEYKEVYGTVAEKWPDQDLYLVNWDAGDANPWPEAALEVVPWPEAALEVVDVSNN